MIGTKGNDRNMTDYCDGAYVPLVIGERRDSGGGNTNAIQTRERALDTYILFLMPDGSTPFCVLIFRADMTDKCDIPVTTLQPVGEFGLREQPHRLFLVSEKVISQQSCLSILCKSLQSNGQPPDPVFAVI